MVKRLDFGMFLLLFVLALALTVWILVQLVNSVPFLLFWCVFASGTMMVVLSQYPHSRTLDTGVRRWMLLLSPLLVACTLPYLLARQRWGN